MASFSAGETALVSGLYKAVHGGSHSASHYVTTEKKDPKPQLGIIRVILIRQPP
jgi:hypothetical protein